MSQEVGRREFLKCAAATSLGAFFVPAGCRSLLASESRLRLGVCSDIHVGIKTELWKWRKVLEHFRDQKVDAVVMSGDMANCGLITELRAVMETWWDVFPDGRRPDGEHVEHVFVTGNHDACGVWGELREKHLLRNPDGTPKKVAKGELDYDLEAAKKESLLFHREALWPELLHEPYSHFFVKRVKGYTFICSNWRMGWQKHDFEAVELPQYLKDHAAELGREKPFFFVQHCHPRGTCHGVDAWWPDSGKNTTDVLKDFPNAVCFSGHSHCPITDLKAIWQGGFTSIGCGSLSYDSPLGRDPKPDILDQAVPPEGHPWKIHNGDCHMAYVIDVHDGFLAVQPMEIKQMQPLADEMVVPVPVGPDPEFAFARRIAAKRPPAYSVQPKVEIRDVEGRNWKGDPCMEQELSFPAVPQGGRSHSRVYAYEITMRPKDGSPTVVKNLRTAAADMAPKMEPDRVIWRVKPGTFRPADQYDFEIVPIDSFRTHAKRDTKVAAVIGFGRVQPPKGWSFDVFEKPNAVNDVFRHACKRYDAFVFCGDAERPSKEIEHAKRVVAGEEPSAAVRVFAPGWDGELGELS